MSNFNNIINNLKSRKVFKSLAIYAGFSFILIQVCDIIFPVLLLPEWTLRFVVILVILGFPTTLILSWTYDITPANESGNNFSDVKDGDSSSKIELSLYQDLIDRRFPHIIILYIMMSWGFVSLVSFIVKEYMLSPNLINLTLFGMISLFPTIFMLAYFHGKSGLRDFKRIEKIGIPMNLLASAILLLAIFSTKELGAVTQIVKFENEEGQMTERVVPRAVYIKKLGIFFFENEKNNLDLDWMHHGFVEGLEFTLDQDLFIEQQVPIIDLGGWRFLTALRDAGFEDGRNSPFALKQELSKNLHHDAFLTGSYYYDSNQIKVKTDLYQSQKGKLISKHSYSSDNIFDLIDSISYHIRYDLEIPEKHIKESKFLSVRDLLTNSIEAFEYQIQGQIKMNINRDHIAWGTYSSKSLELDSTNAWVRWLMAEHHIFSNQKDMAIEHYKAGFKYLYKFPHSFAFTFKNKYYKWVEEDYEKSFKLTKMNAEMSPENKRAQLMLGREYRYRFMIDEAIEKYKDIYYMYPDDHNMLWEIARVYILTGDFENALSYTKEYVNIYSNEAKSYNYLGNVYEYFGYYIESIENYEKALLLDPNNIEYLSDLSDANLNNGIFDASLKICEQMLDLSILPEHFSEAYSCFDSYYRDRGEVRKSIEMIEKNIESIKKLDIGNVGQIYEMDAIAYRYVSIGKFDKALEILQEIDENTIEIFQDESILNYANVYYEIKDITKLRSLIEPMKKLVESNPLYYYKKQLYYTKGLLNELEENFDDAIENHKKAKEFNKTALPQLIGLARCHRLNDESKRAREYVDIALQLYPFHGEVRYESALIYAESGQINKAKEDMAVVLDVWSAADNDHIKANKAKLKLAEWMK